MSCRRQADASAGRDGVRALPEYRTLEARGLTPLSSPLPAQDAPHNVRRREEASMTIYDEGSSDALSPPEMAAWLAMAYRGSQVVIAATKLGVPDALGKGPLTSAEVAQATTTRPEWMHRLLRALAAFWVVRDLGDGRFELTAVGEAL